MKKDYLRTFEYLLVVSLVVAGLVFFTGKGKQDVAFCRDVLFKDLVQGKQSVEKFIDWQKLKALEVDVAESYGKAPNDQERQKYKESFIWGFAVGFRSSGAKAEAFVNWRVYAKGAETVTIAADYPSHKKTLLFTLSKAGGQRKLVALAWQDLK